MYEDVVISILKEHGIDLVSSIPCDKAKDLCFMIPEAFNHVGLTREEDGIGVSAGAYLAGMKPAMVIQSSGLGNSLNALLSLTCTYTLPLPILASWRGVQDEVIPAQVPFNRALPEILKSAGIPYTIIRTHGEMPKIGDLIERAFECATPHVALILPGAWKGDHTCRTGCETISRSRETSIVFRRRVENPSMTRYDAIRVIAGHLDQQAVVSNIGVPGKELYAALDRPLNFYMLGSYTQASPIGLGLSQGTARDVWVIDGDGSLLGTGILPVIATKKPRNLTIFCLDNGAFGSTGNQLTPAYRSADLELIALGAGFTRTWKVEDRESLDSAIAELNDGPNFVHVLLEPGNATVDNIPLTPAQIRDRFMTSL
ncbi:sulfopyruvate decarboxylase subunit beta [Methanolinea mesophila]|uniref:sulfopyruvate decarboxylase subunit beta n=1 Tax=Methanolinea mesophila TaxID=547055 RepID=UPI001AE32301|nr:sulfopyruvate decarboxylase subunit beta [Methanolinea mesophila]MBP1929206.1 sulfopyruvate decarboxylase subunit beta [Methanolinea mesophila]